jgi:hypothetical protein
MPNAHAPVTTERPSKHETATGEMKIAVRKILDARSEH